MRLVLEELECISERKNYLVELLIWKMDFSAWHDALIVARATEMSLLLPTNVKHISGHQTDKINFYILILT